jgi:hypothetical protein
MCRNALGPVRDMITMFGMTFERHRGVSGCERGSTWADQALPGNRNRSMQQRPMKVSADLPQLGDAQRLLLHLCAITPRTGQVNGDAVRFD